MFGLAIGTVAFLLVRHWIVFVTVTILAGGFAYQAWLHTVANGEMIDLGDLPDKGG